MWHLVSLEQGLQSVAAEVELEQRSMEEVVEVEEVQVQELQP